MNSDVRYATTLDGVRIGYSVSGSGPVLISMPDIGFSSMLQAERDLPEVAAWADALSANFTYVRYDARGFGVSQREIEDISLDTWTLDLDAVVESIGATSFVLMGYLGAARPVVKYASERPHKVCAIITWPADYPITVSTDGGMLSDLARLDWEGFTETLAHIALGWDEDARARQLAAFWRGVTTRPLYLQYLEQFRWPTEEEMKGYSALVKIPLLVLVRRTRYLTNRISIAADNPRARLRILPGEKAMPFEGDIDLAVRTMVAFVAASLVVDEPVPEGPISQPRRGPTPSRVLSARELEVLKLVAAAKSNSEIAEELVLSVRTVERHLMRIYDKLGATGKSARVVAAAYANLQELSPQ